MSTAMDALMQAQHKASEALYKQQADAGCTGCTGATGCTGCAAGATSASEGGSKPEGDVIDAEVVDWTTRSRSDWPNRSEI